MPTGSPHGAATEGKSGESAPALNVERLADAVYRLMLAEARLEQSRAGTKGPRG